MTTKQQAGLEAILALSPVVPVMVIDRLEDAVPLARALVRGGLRVLEITLRTAVAMDAIKAIIAEVEGAVVGVGSVLTPQQLDAVAALGVRFAVSPGISPKLMVAARGHSVPLLPGATSASEVMTLLEEGYLFQKFFPAEASGGVKWLSSIAAPIPAVRFCPTGGIDAAKAPSYLALKNVVCIGGSWMVPAAAVVEGQWDGIEDAARAAFALTR